MWTSWIITEKYHKRSISTGEMYSTIGVEWAGVHMLLVIKLIHIC